MRRRSAPPSSSFFSHSFLSSSSSHRCWSTHSIRLFLHTASSLFFSSGTYSTVAHSLSFSLSFSFFLLILQPLSEFTRSTASLPLCLILYLPATALLPSSFNLLSILSSLPDPPPCSVNLPRLSLPSLFSLFLLSAFSLCI